MTRAVMNAAWDKFCGKYDLLSNEWQDMGADEYFAAGWKAATERAALARPVEPTIHIEDCNFQGLNADGSEPFLYKMREDGFGELDGIRMIGWRCDGPKKSTP